MKREQLYHLYCSGMVTVDLIPEWEHKNREQFCHYCHTLKLPHGGMDVITDGKIRKNLDMANTGYFLIPSSMSLRLLNLLGEEAEKHLNIGSIYNKVESEKHKQPFITFISKYDYVVLRGEKPYLFDGQPIPENGRLVVCPECHFHSRRERAPWFLLESEYPPYPICCTDLGLLLYESIYERLKTIKLVGVCVEKVKIK
ncbi:hypothetical protein J3U57_06865 [Gilliamella sp. B3464]|uniref:hypothetical protein n=1 Tax=unclassified Gilliamella TaxID=2685620 RepID=UPI00226AC8BC|nr:MULTISPECIES: hypothetical protein [unclassified Gilliamella]MCX8712167.1 hypothetical protein [Gilliamella sp. B3468]MCX8751288.1 hypothetical protein [Gilliamella sp. B3464]